MLIAAENRALSEISLVDIGAAVLVVNRPTTDRVVSRLSGTPLVIHGLPRGGGGPDRGPPPPFPSTAPLSEQEEAGTALRGDKQRYNETV